DDLALVDLVALLQARREASQVRVEGLHAIAVLQDDHVAVAALLAGEVDDAVARGADRRAGGSREIGALVRAHVAEHRVLGAVGKAGTDAAELERVAQEAALHAAAVEAEEFALAVFTALEPERLVVLAGVDQLNRQHAGADRPFEAVGLADGFVDHA